MLTRLYSEPPIWRPAYTVSRLYSEPLRPVLYMRPALCVPARLLQSVQAATVWRRSLGAERQHARPSLTAALARCVKAARRFPTKIGFVL